MKLWHDMQKWNEYCSQDGCPVCNKRGEEKTEEVAGVLIKQLRVSKLSAFRANPTKGYCCLTSVPHAIELFDLTEEDALDFMRDLRLSAKVLKDVTGAIKINYDIHGNTIPHLHVHLFPRQTTDCLDKPPTTAVGATYAEGEFETFVESMKRRLQ